MPTSQDFNYLLETCGRWRGRLSILRNLGTLANQGYYGRCSYDWDLKNAEIYLFY